MPRPLANKRQSLRQSSGSNDTEPVVPNRFVGVVVPVSRTTPSSGFTSPNVSSTRSGTVDLDTPNTSTFVTPAASVSGGARRSSARSSLLNKATALNESKMASPQPGSKRKRTSTSTSNLNNSTVVSNTTLDEQLARQLQEDEYNDEDEEVTRPKKRGRPSEMINLITDSELEVTRPKKRGQSSKVINLISDSELTSLDSDSEVSVFIHSLIFIANRCSIYPIFLVFLLPSIVSMKQNQILLHVDHREIVLVRIIELV
jgi:hypothetical protein